MRQILNTDARDGGDHTANFGCEKIMDTGIAAGFHIGYLLKKKKRRKKKKCVPHT
jgi:hypothetical protein